MTTTTTQADSPPPPTGLTATELIKILNKLPGNCLIVITDPEGNEYSPAHDTEDAMYTDETGKAGAISPIPENTHLHTPHNAVRALVLYPMG